jgi:CRP-like cAMP-binding protein
MRALAIDPGDRYATVVDLKREVEAFLQGKLTFPVQTFVPGERIVTEGEHGDSAYVIEKGTCAAYTAGAGTCSTLRELSAGNVFGEEVVLSPGPRQCTVEAMTDVSVRVVTKKMIEEGLGRDSWFGAFIMALADRLRRT